MLLRVDSPQPSREENSGWQVTAIFQVSQHVSNREVLDRLAHTFGCGSVRSKGPNSSAGVFVVSSLRQLDDRVIPFFEKYGLRGQAT